MIQLEDHGSIVLFRPLTEEASEWLAENTDGQWFSGALSVEPRYVADLAAAIEEAFGD